MDRNEEAADKFLTARAFRPERFPKTEQQGRKTPDFRVFQGADFRFYSEVKGIQEDTWLDKHLAAAPPGVVVGGGRPDPTYNRLTTDIHEAVKQFNAVNPNQA